MVRSRLPRVVRRGVRRLAERAAGGSRRTVRIAQCGFDQPSSLNAVLNIHRVGRVLAGLFQHHRRAIAVHEPGSAERVGHRVACARRTEPLGVRTIGERGCQIAAGVPRKLGARRTLVQTVQRQRSSARNDRRLGVIEHRVGACMRRVRRRDVHVAAVGARPARDRQRVKCVRVHRGGRADRGNDATVVAAVLDTDDGEVPGRGVPLQHPVVHARHGGVAGGEAGQVGSVRERNAIQGAQRGRNLRPLSQLAADLVQAIGGRVAGPLVGHRHAGDRSAVGNVQALEVDAPVVGKAVVRVGA